jgi:tetratricopeptide (TPR) repeat protein
MTKTWRSAAVTIALLICAATARADGDNNASPFVIGQAIPLPVKSYTAAELEQLFPQFKHRPFETAGFDALMLPFHYVDHSGNGNAKEALAFSFLFSLDLDWSPGCYCARHAFFVFKQSREDMVPLSKEYDQVTVTKVISDWGDTHAVGGTVVRESDGYSGNLNIFDPSGKIIFTKNYPQHQSYWDLLASMDIDAMTYFGDPPPDSLKAHLRLPRCQQMQSLIDLGGAAFLKEWSAEDMGTYRKILDVDPDFAEVRAWYASQNWWLTRDTAEKQHQMGLSLESRLTAAALSDFQSDECRDSDLVARYPRLLQHAEKIADPDSPLLLKLEFRRLFKRPAPAPDLLNRATKIAEKYPNSMDLLSYLAEAYRNPLIGRGNMAMSASILLAAMENRFQPGTGTRDPEADQFLEDAFNCGYRDPGLVTSIKKLTNLEDNASLQKWFIHLMAEGGQFKAAIPIAQDALNDDPTLDMGVASPLAFSAAMCGDRETLDRCLNKYAKAIDNDEIGDALRYCSDRLAGKEASGPLPSSKPSWIFAMQVNWAILAEDDWKRHEHKHRDSLIKASNWQPQARIGWIIHDMYDRQEPTKYNDDFYRSIEWLYPDDPWVVSAVADFKARNKSTIIPTSQPADVLADLAPFDAGPDITPDNPQLTYANDLGGRLTPWRIVISIRRLIEAGRIDDARLLARRYQSAVCCWENNTWLQGFASRILWRIDQIQAQQASTH